MMVVKRQDKTNKRLSVKPKEKVYNYYRFKDLTSDYVEILFAPRPHLVKLIWVIWFLSMAVLGIWLTKVLFENYLNHDTSTEITSRHSSYIEFPSIEICPLNLMNYTYLEETYDEITVKKINKIIRAAADNKVIDQRLYQDLDLNRNIFTNAKLRTSSMAVDNEFIFGGEVYKGDTFEQVPTESGYCMSFNADGNWVQRMAGGGGGFSIVLDAKTDLYLPSTSSTGFRVIVHQPNETVLTSQYGYLVSPGTQTDIKLTKRIVRKLSEPWGDCVDEQSEFSSGPKSRKTVPECSANKTLLAYMEVCKCLPWWLYDRFPNSDIPKTYEDLSSANSSYECSFVEFMACGASVLDILNVVNQTVECSEPCLYTQYTASISTALYPASQKYFEAYIERLNVANDWNYGNYSTLGQARENMLNLRIFFEDVKVESEIQTASYNFGSFVAEVGGMLDLFIGFSFFTVIQLVEIVFGWGLSWRKKKKGPEVDMGLALPPPTPSTSGDGIAYGVTSLFE